MLDGYARQDVLDKYDGFDNGDFLRQLQARGLQVSTQSSSNYAWTFLSLVSTLNMRYVADLFQGRLGPESLDRSIVDDAIRDNDVARFLRKSGYEIVHLRSTWGATSVNPYADREIRCESSVYNNEFVRAVAESSWLGAFHTKAGVDLAHCRSGELPCAAKHPLRWQTKVRFCAFRAATSSLSLRQGRPDTPQRRGVEPVRVPEAALGRPGQLPRPAPVREPEDPRDG